jgi:hypothetical protein
MLIGVYVLIADLGLSPDVGETVFGLGMGEEDSRGRAEHFEGSGKREWCETKKGDSTNELERGLIELLSRRETPLSVGFSSNSAFGFSAPREIGVGSNVHPSRFQPSLGSECSESRV